MFTVSLPAQVQINFPLDIKGIYRCEFDLYGQTEVGMSTVTYDVVIHDTAYTGPY